MVNRIITFIFIILISSTGFSQIPVGFWREHLPYKQGIAVADDGNNRVYCATPFSLFYYNRDDHSINKISSVNKLSDIGVSTIAFDKETKTLIIGYQNGNIDLLRDDVVFNISDIKRKQIIGSKNINHIMIHDGNAYLSTAFGIVVLDLKRREIKDTYFIGENGKSLNINKVIADDDSLYAVTEGGLYRASLSDPNLANFQNWYLDSLLPNFNKDFNQITKYKNKLIVNSAGKAYGTDTMYQYENGKWSKFKSHINQPVMVLKTYGDTLIVGKKYGFLYYFNDLKDSTNVYTYNQPENNILPMANDIIIDYKNIAWIADDIRGLVENWKEWGFVVITPSGPSSKFAWGMDLVNSNLWVVSGAYQSTGANSFLRKGVYNFRNEEWTSYDAATTGVFDTINDVVSVAVNPKNPDEVYIGTWGQGLLKIAGGEVVKVYDPSNSSLEYHSLRPGFCAVGGLKFDMEGNLWVSNSSTPNGLSKLTPAGDWKSYSLAPYVSDDITGAVEIDDLNQKWIVLPRGKGILVYNDNFTPDNPWDDRKTVVNGLKGQGGLPSSTVLSIAKDLDGEIWVGTAKGVAVFYSPELVFSGNDYDAQQIYIEQEGISQYLLESEEVSAVAIDGANRKWFGTRNAGVFLMSDDGTEQIHHFNTSNSPLLSDNIYDIAIDHKTGEVFFATEKGIISYRSDATQGAETHDSVKVFPNPVRPEYNGLITISGLVTNAYVKITDIQGSVIYEATANGGTVTWNGKNYSGDRAATGVYLVFSTSDDGTETKVAKILFIH